MTQSHFRVILLVFVVGFISLIFLSTALSHSRPEASALAISYIDTQYAADFSNDAVLMGASHNVFVGKVLAQVGTKERGIGPETQFSVQVISNIKGDLKGTVTVDQQGGVKNNVLYVIGDDTENGGGYLLKPGSTYLLATRYNQNEDWYTLNSYPTASKLLSSSQQLTNTQLKDLSNKDPRVQALVAAYPKEILLQADVVHNNARNSFISVHSKLSQ